MPLFNSRKPKGLESLSPDEIESLIQQTRTEISLIEKDNERKQEKFDSLMKEGSKSSGSKRIQIAQELELTERKIHSNENKILENTKKIELMQEVKESKTSISPSSIDSILSRTDSNAIKSSILKTKTKTKVTSQKTDDLLNTVRDLQIEDEEGSAVMGSKYMEMFKEMDKNDNSLKPNKLKKSEDNKESEENPESSTGGE